MPLTALERQNRHYAKRLAEIAQMDQIPCACGCGELIPPINKQLKPATYKHGHNPVAIRTKGIPKSPEQIAKKLATHQARYGDNYMSDEGLERLRARRGEAAPGWKGGISSDPYGPEFRSKTFKNQIRARDGYECQRCGKTQADCGRALDVHHVNGDKMNNSPSNLVALCGPCNTWFIHHMEESVEMFSYLTDDLSSPAQGQCRVVRSRGRPRSCR